MTFEIWTQPETWVSLLTLTALEVVLGIDNIVFLSILTQKLAPAQQPLARRLGLSLALVLRLLLLLVISWVMSLAAPWFTLLGHAFSGRHLIFLGGGLFLVAKSTHEIYEKLEGGQLPGVVPREAALGWVLLQVVLLDMVFSLDSVITAVGMARHISVMVIAMCIAVGIMLVFAGSISDFVKRHPSMKILALSFLLLIGVMLVMEGMGQHVSKGSLYFAMAFSLGVELANMRMRQRQQPLHLHHRFEEEGGGGRTRA